VIYLYLFSLVLGGVLLGASMILGSHGEAHADAPHGGATPDAADDSAAGIESFLVAFLSVRFWTFFLAFFGLTGFVLDGLGLVGSPVVAGVLSVLMGLGAGTGAAWIMRRVRGDEANSAATEKDYVGKTGRVLVAFGPGQTGKLRLEVRGSTIDLLAMPIAEESFELREEAIVVEMDGTRAKVAKLTPDRISKG
jgi:hypothetical protein